MKKVIVVGVALACAVGLVAIGGMADVQAQTIELKMAHFMPPVHIQHQKSFVPFTEKVAELSGGKVKIKIYPAGQLGKAKQLADACATGVTDIAFIIPSYTTARFPRTSVLDLPFICDSAVHATKVFYEMQDKGVAEDYKDYKVLWFYSAGVGQFQSVTKAMPTVASLGGMKMRTPGAYMSKAMKALGINPVGMPVPKLYMSLEKKVIDGVLTPFSAVKDFKLFDLVKHITQVDMYVLPMAVIMNKKKWDSLPDFAKQAIDQASGKEMGMHAAKVYDDHDANTLAEIKKQGKIQVIQLPAAEMKLLKKKVKAVEDMWVSDMEKQGHKKEAKKLLKAVKKSAAANR